MGVDNHCVLSCVQPGIKIMNEDPNRNHYYKKVFTLGQIVTSEVDLGKLFDVIIDQINQIMQTEICSVFLYDPETDELYSQVSTDVEKNEIRISIDYGICGWVYQNKKTHLFSYLPPEKI